MFFTYNNIHSRVRLHYAGNLVFERFSPSEYFYFTPYLITQLQKLEIQNNSRLHILTSITSESLNWVLRG